ncbi:hypothetical protein Fmac_026016 [Flemingia macrophylla]|uniref:Uncharacterized protein n=1 Tax=Flemingia macrophylla TaxID=520843 RepID=A0ABD1LDQ6_9FABA
MIEGLLLVLELRLEVVLGLLFFILESLHLESLADMRCRWCSYFISFFSPNL